ncbi:hypothetical protein JAAARDRAFT_187402 [Jaapia argillacea MUCL 33604]|uniref:Uncharacterized protein n=1 Tax=Jaapia argillacea MUCL 33604 TaxID=933084 RepID=A0A067QN20_9AGAM|nr:hypothetical protein JAAARDRAFT_187402 [Jaapia argillacea MUCL 33604]
MSNMMGFFFRDWNLKYVVKYERREDVRRRIAKTVSPEVKGNDKWAFACYQTVVSEIMKELTDKERWGYTIQAEKWNQIGAPPLVKSQNAESRAHKIMSTFANRCQEKLATEVMILYSYHTPAGEVEVFVRKKVKVKDWVVQPTEFDGVDDLSETLEKLQDGKVKRSKARSRKQKPDLQSNTDETDWELAQNGSGDDENSLASTRSQGKKKHQAAIQDVIEVGMTSKAKGKVKAQEDLYNSEHTDWELHRHGSPDEDKRNTEREGKRNEIVAMFSDIDSDSSTPANKKGQPSQVKKTPAGMSKTNKGKVKQKSTPQTALVDDLPGTDKGKQPIKFPSNDNLPSEVPSSRRLSRWAHIENSEESESEPATPVATPVTKLITHPKPHPLANLAMARQLKEEADNATSQAQENGKAVFVPALPTPEPESMKSLMRVPSKLKVQPVKKRP